MNEKYPEKSPNYSPSISYNYSPQSGYNGNSQMHRRPRNDRNDRTDRNDRFRRDSVNPNERVIRQNDIIIRLLKEIRDRLPAPQYTQQQEADSPEPQNGISATPESWDNDENTHETPVQEKIVAPPDDIKNPRMSGPNEDTI